MLKNCLSAENYHKSLNAKCGEIICQTETDFTIICTFCKIKHFEFDDFLKHFKNLHLDVVKSGNKNIWNLNVKQEAVQQNDFDCSNDDEELFPDEAVDNEFEIIRIFNEQDEIDTDAAAATVAEPDKEDDCKENVFKTINDEKEHKFTCNIVSEAEDGDPIWQADDDDDDSSNEEEDDKRETAEEEDDMKILKKQRKPKEFRCDHCGKSYAAMSRLKIHITLKHLKAKEFKCDLCNDEFTEERFLDAHLRKVHIGYPCDKCDKVFKKAASLRDHGFMHTDVRDFVCDFESCGKAFVSKRRLMAHKRWHTAERNYVCEVCGFRTRLRDALKVHNRTHTGEKPYRCQVCDKRFISGSLLHEHMAMHSTERPHKCDICGAAFSRAKALYHHKPLHSAVKQFICKVCGNAYAQRAGLSGHMRQHKMEGLI